MRRVPFVHMWSPTFVPKPPDWGPLVDVVGNFFTNKLEVGTRDLPGLVWAVLGKSRKGGQIVACVPFMQQLIPALNVGTNC